MPKHPNKVYVAVEGQYPEWNESNFPFKTTHEGVNMSRCARCSEFFPVDELKLSVNGLLYACKKCNEALKAHEFKRKIKIHASSFYNIMKSQLKRNGI